MMKDKCFVFGITETFCTLILLLFSYVLYQMVCSLTNQYSLHEILTNIKHVYQQGLLLESKRLMQ